MKKKNHIPSSHFPSLFSQIATCEVKNGFPKFNITWYRNNTPLQASSSGERTPATQPHIVPSEFSVFPCSLALRAFFLTHGFFFYCHPKVDITPRITTESSGLFSVSSDLRMTVTKEVNNDLFYCDVSYFVPSETRLMESRRINVTVLCEFRSPVLILLFHLRDGKE